MGYTKCCCKDDGNHCGLWLPKGISQEEWFSEGAPLTSFHSDLNAMHEAEKLLKKTGCCSHAYSFFQDTLVDVVGDKRDMRSPIMRQHLIHATAKQRAIAFVVTMTNLAELAELEELEV